MIVRLKAAINAATTSAVSSFNSMIVRLKGDNEFSVLSPEAKVSIL